MKKLTLFFLIVIVISCNNGATTSKEAMKDSASMNTSAATPTNYPYTIDHPDNREMGSTANTAIALKSLKAWEDGKMDESLKYFNDSVMLHLDGLNKKMSKDSLKAMFENGWKTVKGVNIKMNDWESVVSKDKKEEWVTLWYRQSWQNSKGVKDSVDIVNDLQLKDGKIIALNEYTRKLH